MATRGYIFSADSAARIGNVVKRVEGEPTSTSGAPSGITPKVFGRDLHVRIGSERGVGMYDATLLTPSDVETIDPDADVTEADIGVEHEPEDGVSVVAINTAQIGGTAGAVAEGSVWPCRIVRRPTPESPVLFVSFAPGGGEPPKLLTIGTPLGGLGYYNAGTIVSGGTPINIGAALTLGALGGGAGDSVVFAHLLEADTDGTDSNLSLPIGVMGFGVYVGKSSEDPPRRVYAGYAFKGQNCKTTGPDESEI